MRKVALLIPLVILASALAGCRSKSVSRVCPADMESTWNALLKVTEKVTGVKPLEADRQAGRIVTEPMCGTINRKYEGGYAPRAGKELVQAILTCKPAQSGTKVTIRVEKGYARSDDTPTPADDKLGGSTRQAYSVADAADIWITVPGEAGFAPSSAKGLLAALFRELSAELSSTSPAATSE